MGETGHEGLAVKQPVSSGVKIQLQKVLIAFTFVLFIIWCVKELLFMQSVPNVDDDLYLIGLPDVVGTSNPDIVTLQDSGASCNWRTGTMILDNAIELRDVKHYATMCDYAKRKMYWVMQASPSDRVTFESFTIEQEGGRTVMKANGYTACDITDRNQISPASGARVDTAYAYGRDCVKAHRDLHNKG